MSKKRLINGKWYGRFIRRDGGLYIKSNRGIMGPFPSRKLAMKFWNGLSETKSVYLTDGSSVWRFRALMVLDYCSVAMQGAKWSSSLLAGKEGGGVLVDLLASGQIKRVTALEARKVILERGGEYNLTTVGLQA